MLDNWFEAGVYAWDLVTAVNMTHPEFCESDALYVEVISEKGAVERRIISIDGEEPNVSACLPPNSNKNKTHLKEVFRQKY